MLKVAQRDNPQLVGRLMSWRLGKWTPTEEAQLREGVRLGAIELIYKKELEVDMLFEIPIYIGIFFLYILYELPCSQLFLMYTAALFAPGL